jgi:hypothetical protein
MIMTTAITRTAAATAEYSIADITTMKSDFEDAGPTASPSSAAVTAHPMYKGTSLRPSAGISYFNSLPNI